MNWCWSKRASFSEIVQPLNSVFAFVLVQVETEGIDTHPDRPIVIWKSVEIISEFVGVSQKIVIPHRIGFDHDLAAWITGSDRTELGRR